MTSKSALHDIYTAIHRNRDAFETNYRCQLVSNLMGRQLWSWRVVGITPAAVRQFAAQGFKYISGCGITRAHITPRNKMVAEIMAVEMPMTEAELFDYWLAHDRTVICVRGENVDPVPEYLPIDNPKGELFTSKKIAGFNVRTAEKELLRKLASEMVGG